MSRHFHDLRFLFCNNLGISELPNSSSAPQRFYPTLPDGIGYGTHCAWNQLLAHGETFWCAHESCAHLHVFSTRQDQTKRCHLLFHFSMHWWCHCSCYHVTFNWQPIS